MDEIFGSENKKNVITFKRSSVSGAKVINPGVVNVSEFIIVYSRNTSEWKPNRIYRQKERDNRYNTYIENKNESYEKWRYCSVLEAFAKHNGISKSELKKKLGNEYEIMLENFYYDNAENIIRFAALDDKSIGKSIVEAKYNTYDKSDETIIDDVYCPGKKVAITNNTSNYMTLASKGTAKTSKKEMMTLESGAPSLDQIFSVTLKPMVEEKQINGDKLTVSGMLEAKIIFIDPEHMNMIQTAVEMIPFSQEFTLEGLSKDAYIDVKVQPKDVEVGIYNKNDIMIEYVLDYLVNVFKKETVQTINQVAVEDMDKEQLNNYPSITVYVVKKGDTLWSLAKRFNTTVQDIIEINDLDENATLNVGQKLIILKKTKF